MGLISPGGENLLDFLEFRQVRSNYDGDLRDPLWWPQESPVPMQVAWGPLGIPLPWKPGLRPCEKLVPEPEDSSPVLTWILGYFWSLPRGVSTSLQCGHARAVSSRAVTASFRYASCGSRDQWLSLEALTRGFPTWHFHRDVPRATVVCIDARLESPGSAGKTGFPGMD